MDHTKPFMESIGLCRQLKASLASRCKEAIELSISGDPALVGIRLHLDEVAICGGQHRLKSSSTIELNDEQVLQLRDLLDHALCVNGYGRIQERLANVAQTRSSRPGVIARSAAAKHRGGA